MTYFSDEVKTFYGLARLEVAGKKFKTVDAQEYLAKISKIKKSKSNLVVTDLRVTPSIDPNRKPEPAVAKSSMRTSDQSFDIDSLFEKLFVESTPEDTDQVQRKIQKIVEKKDLSSSTILKLKNFLEDVRRGRIWSSHVYGVMAIFELAAMHKNIPYEIYELTLQMAHSILNQPEYVSVKYKYNELLTARQPPAICRKILGDR